MVRSGFFNSFHRNSHGELKSTFFDPFEVKHRKRTSKSQLNILEKTFETNKKPDSALRNQLSEQLGMTPRSVQVWFQNRRAKQKKSKDKKYLPKIEQALIRENTPDIHHLSNGSGMCNEMKDNMFNETTNRVKTNIQQGSVQQQGIIQQANVQQESMQQGNMQQTILQQQGIVHTGGSDIFSFDTNNNIFNIKKSPSDGMFQPIHMLDQNTTFCNDRYPISPLHNYPFKSFPTDYQSEFEFNENFEQNKDGLEFPPVESLDSTWIDMRKTIDQDENLNENTVCFDPDNFFC